MAYLQDYGGRATCRTIGVRLLTGLWGGVTYSTMGEGLLAGLEVTETTASTKPLPQHGSKFIKPGNLEHTAQSADSSTGC